MKFWGRYQQGQFLLIINQSHIIHTSQCMFYIQSFYISTSPVTCLQCSTRPSCWFHASVFYWLIQLQCCSKQVCSFWLLQAPSASLFLSSGNICGAHSLQEAGSVSALHHVLAFHPTETYPSYWCHVSGSAMHPRSVIHLQNAKDSSSGWSNKIMQILFLANSYIFYIALK